MKNEIFYNIHDLVYIKISPNVSNLIINQINFQIGAFQKENIKTNKKIPIISIEPFDKMQDYQKNEKKNSIFHFHQGIVGEDFVDIENKIYIKKKGNIILICADFPNIFINFYIQLLILSGGYVFCHAGAYENKDKKINIIAGAGGIGKTAMIAYVVNDLGFRYLGDDLVLLGPKRECFSFPRNFIIKKYHKNNLLQILGKNKVPKWNFFKIKLFLLENAPFAGFFKKILKKYGLYYKVADIFRPQEFLVSLPPSEIFGKNKQCQNGKINRIIYIDKTLDSKISVKFKINKKKIINRLVSVIHNEFKLIYNQAYSLGALNVINLSEYFVKIVENYNNALKGVEIIELKIPYIKNQQEINLFLKKNNLL